MRILYISADPGIPFWGSKGASIHIREFTRALVSAGHKVDVVIVRNGIPQNDLPVSLAVKEIPVDETTFFDFEKYSGKKDKKVSGLLSEARAFSNNQTLARWLKGNARQKKYDLVYERYSLFSFSALNWAGEQRIPYLLEVNAPLVREAEQHRSLILKPLTETIQNYLFQRATGVIAVSRPLTDYIRRFAPDQKILTLPNGVDLELFASGQDNGWRKRFSANPDQKFLIGFVGSLKPWHGTEFLLEVFANLCEKDGAVHLVFVGDGPLRKPLEEQSHRLGVAEKVTFTGAVAHKEMPALLAGLDLMVAPYPKIEEFYFSPLKIFEYMAAGKPILASRIGQLENILEDQKTALLVAPGDTPGYVAAILQLRKDRALCERLGRQARQIAFERHSWAQRVATMETFLAQTAIFFLSNPEAPHCKVKAL